MHFTQKMNDINSHASKISLILLFFIHLFNIACKWMNVSPISISDKTPKNLLIQG